MSDFENRPAFIPSRTIHEPTIPPRAKPFRWRAFVCGAALLMVLGEPLTAAAQVTSFNTRTGSVTSQTGDYSCAQVTNCGPTNATNTWTGQQNISVPYPSKSMAGVPFFPIINGATSGAVSSRSQTMLQVVGSPLSGADQEVNVVDSFAYNGFAQYDAERFDIGLHGGAVQSGEIIGAYSFEPFDSVSDSNTAELEAGATENQDNATNHHGTDLALSYTPNGTANLRYIGICISCGGLGGVTVGDNGGYQSPPPDLGRSTLNVASDIGTGGHLRTFGSTPTLSACGTGTFVSGAGSNDIKGFVFNNSANSSCKVTFNKPYVTSEVCMVQDYNNSSPTIFVSSLTLTSFTVSWSSTYAGGWFYTCTG